MKPDTSARPSHPNRTRDHLANERTYLAWMRTAIALIGFGLVVVRLRYALPAATQGPLHAWPIGLLFCLTGLGTVGFATTHYFHIQRAIENDDYQPEKRWIWVGSAPLMALGDGTRRERDLVCLERALNLKKNQENCFGMESNHL